MRSSYRKELKKVAQCKKSGASGEVYEPSLWYFHMLDFLYDQEIPRGSISNMPIVESCAEEENEVSINKSYW
jgi:hypothetical protein